MAENKQKYLQLRQLRKQLRTILIIGYNEKANEGQDYE